MRTRDGTRLEADLHRPDGPGPWPVLLMRLVEGRRVAQSSHYAHPGWYAGHGYLVVVQDVRGTGGSAGRFHPFVSEADDGAEAVAWAASLPGASGRVGMLGAGYAGFAQVLAAALAPAALAAIAPAFAGGSAYADWAYEGGAFRQADAMRLALRLGAAAARRVEDGTAHRALAEAAAALPFSDEIPARPRCLRDYGRYTHYDDWLSTPGPGGAWAALSAGLLPPELAALRVAGWHDGRLAGDLAAHRAAEADGGAAPRGLIVGPWSGEGWGRRCGALDLGPEAAPDMDRLHLAFFDHVLKGNGSLFDDRPVRLFDSLARRWRGFERWPVANGPTLNLASSGRAASREGAGRLTSDPAAAAVDRLVHDPAAPVPALGTHGTPSAGLQDRSGLDARPDVACFTGPVLEAPLPLAGTATLELWVEADAPSFDVSAVLSAVLPDGRVLALTHGHARVEVGDPTRPLRLSLRALCATLEPGMALRLSLAGAAAGAYPINPGTGAEPAETRQVDAQPITLLIHSGGDRPSRLLLSAGGG